MLTENRQTTKLLSLGLGGLVALLAGTAEAQQRTLHATGVSITGPNDRCGDEIWPLSGIPQGPDSHGTFLGLKDPSSGSTSPIPLTPADCAAPDFTQLVVTNYDAAYGALRGWTPPNAALLNRSMRSVLVPAGNGVRAPIPLPGSVPPNPLPPTIARPTDPVTVGKWLAAGGDMTITCNDIENTGTFSATFHNLIPHGVYTLWGSWVDPSGVVIVVPFGGLPNTLVAGQTGAGSIHRVLDFCPLDLAPDSSQLQYVSLAYHADTVTYGAVPSEPFTTRAFVGVLSLPFLSTIPGGVVTFDQVGFPVNVIDACPLDALKTEPGLCGCGIADIDTDVDGTPDCNDGCPADPNKIEAGACGCGVEDADTDLDGTPDCIDGCPNDAGQTEPGACGCGASDVDSDGDGTPDGIDGCPNDAGKTVPGACGCGIADVDSDGDGTPDCLDGCPNDASKTVPGACGCGASDVDSDGDGTPDRIDGCPNDVGKTVPGACGCGIADVDSDGDGTPDCIDGCPNDAGKTVPGACGCGIPDVDSDGDGTPDCDDGCPTDPNKIAAGVCGCGVADTDTDLDNTPDCNDLCPNNSNKLAPGVCGCGVADADADLDGALDCNDGCPNDASKTAPGTCGCSVSDADSDGDGTPDCNDSCPNDAGKTAPGACGCGTADTDSDGNGIPDCLDPTCTGPAATASLDLVSGGDGEGSNGNDDDEGRFLVGFGFASQVDTCDPTACIGELVCGSMRIAVSSGQIVEIENDDEGCEIEIEDGFIEVEGPNVFLEVTCTNSAGADTAQAYPLGIGLDNDTDADDDD